MSESITIETLAAMKAKLDETSRIYYKFLGSRRTVEEDILWRKSCKDMIEIEEVYATAIDAFLTIHPDYTMGAQPLPLEDTK